MDDNNASEEDEALITQARQNCNKKNEVYITKLLKKFMFRQGIDTK